jgi:hypothetical protein
VDGSAQIRNSPQVGNKEKGKKEERIEISVKYVVSGFSRTGRGPPDQPPLKLRRSAEALAKAEGGHYVRANTPRGSKRPFNTVAVSS